MNEQVQPPMSIMVDHTQASSYLIYTYINDIERCGSPILKPCTSGADRGLEPSVAVQGRSTGGATMGFIRLDDKRIPYVWLVP